MRKYPLIITQSECTAPKTAPRIRTRYAGGDSPREERRWMAKHAEHCVRCEVILQNLRTAQKIVEKERIDPLDIAALFSYFTPFSLED